MRIENRAGVAGGVFEHVVVVAVGEPGGPEELARPRDVRLARRRHTRIPPPVGRRDRTKDWFGRAEVDRVDDRLAIDRARDRLPEFPAADPRRPPGARREPRRPQVEREKVGVERDADINHAQPALPDETPEGGVVLRADVAVAHQVALGRFEPERLGVLIGDDRERQPIEVRQLDAGRVAPEVVRVAREHEPLPGDVLDELKRPETDDLGDRP